MKGRVDSLLHFVTHTNQQRGGKEGNSYPPFLYPPFFPVPAFPPITKTRLAAA